VVPGLILLQRGVGLLDVKLVVHLNGLRNGDIVRQHVAMIVHRLKVHKILLLRGRPLHPQAVITHLSGHVPSSTHGSRITDWISMTGTRTDVPGFGSPYSKAQPA
jgi:hypothetical protein